MIDLSLKLSDRGNIAKYKRLLSQSSDIVSGIVLRTVNESQLGGDILSDFQTEPGPVARPIQWASAKQRRYVMMRIRKGEIRAPYIRTHTLSKGWRFYAAREQKNTTTIHLENPTEYATFVEGIHQQPFHKQTGWYQEMDKARKWLPLIRTAIVEGIKYALTYHGP